MRKSFPSAFLPRINKRNTDYQSHKEEFSFRLQFTYRLWILAVSLSGS